MRIRLGQVREALRVELARGVGGWRSLWLLAIAFAPCMIIVAHALHDGGFCRVDHESLILAGMMQVYYMRVAIFFGALGVFLRLFKSEIAERTLHYPFLAPLRRESLVVGKFLAGAGMTIGVFAAAVITAFGLMYGHSAAGRAFALSGTGLRHLAIYVLVAALACLGYGAVFLALSLFVRNPIVPAVIFLVWEGINGAMPAWLKRFSVTFYLKPLFPVELPVGGISGLFTVVAEPVGSVAAVTGLLAFTAAVVALACWRIRQVEVSYSTD